MALRSAGSALAATSFPIDTRDDIECCRSASIFFRNCEGQIKEIKVSIMVQTKTAKNLPHEDKRFGLSDIRVERVRTAR